MNILSERTEAHTAMGQSARARVRRAVAGAALALATAALAIITAAPAQAEEPVALAGLSQAAALNCPMRYKLPGDVSNMSQADFDKYSWQTFLALNTGKKGKRYDRKGNKVPWSKWSSTDGLIECARNPKSKNCVCPNGDCFASGAEYYPDECRAIEGHKNYRVLAEVSKVDDLFLQATHGALSNDPLIDANGHFLRFEILASPVTHKYVVDNEFYDASVLDNLTEDLLFPCGEQSYTGGNPKNTKSGAYVVKNAWMQLPDDANAFGSKYWGDYHMEELLVYTPSYRNKTGVATCEKRVMGLVGQHIAHKTVKQPRWTWSTFEHKRNAPNCTELPPTGDQDDAGPSTACPASVKRNFNFYAKSCSANGSDPAACQTCNAGPVSNRKGCDNPDVADDVSWCIDKPPAKTAGMTMACLQVNPRKYYPTAHAMNRACVKSLGRKSVWSNYRLISTQWYNEASTSCTTQTTVDRALELPQVPIPGRGGKTTTPYLANSSMETYVRANCMGCHGHPTVGKNSVSTDFMYWILLESANTESMSRLADLLENSPH